MLPGEDWPARLAEAIAVTIHSGRGAVAVVPDGRDLERLEHALGQTVAKDRFVALHAALGPAERYRRFLRASRGEVSAVIGTRAAAFAPVRDLDLVAIWDDGDDLHAEPRAPYPHALQVLLIRAQLAGAAALVAATARSAEAQLLVETRWAREIVAPREVVRHRAPAITPTGDDADRARDQAAVTARLPSVAWRIAKDALAAGAPVLVQVPRRGYVPSVSCVECHTPARCARCAGPLELRSSHAVAACRWCGKPAADFACHRCGQRRLRASIVGSARTAEELGRAFPGVPVRTSGRDQILSQVDGEPALVVATPGAEPVAGGGYGAVLLLDTWALLTRADLRAGEETLRRWLAAATLARSAAAGGKVVVVADGALSAVQALLRWDPATFAARELAERRELGFPPAARMASLTGPTDAVSELLALTDLPDRVGDVGTGAGWRGGTGAGTGFVAIGRCGARGCASRRGRRAQRAQGGGACSGPGRPTRALVASAIVAGMDVGDAVGELLAGHGRVDPYPVYEAIRAHGPLARVQERFYVATGYDMVDRVLRDPRMLVPDRELAVVLRHRGRAGDRGGDRGRPLHPAQPIHPTTPGCGGWPRARSLRADWSRCARRSPHRPTRLPAIWPILVAGASRSTSSPSSPTRCRSG